VILYRRYAWFTLAFTVAVILWGAYVRATGSGAGCGSHWPLCDGEVIPRAPDTAKVIEFTHRLTSGLSLLFVLALYVISRRLFARGSFARKAAGYSLIAILLEAAIGAGLVVFEWVGLDKSVYRAFSIGLHLVNTLFLLAALTLSAQAGSEEKPRWKWPTKGRERIWVRGLVWGFALLGALGALTALGDTLFPVGSVAEGWSRKFAENSHFLEQIRIVHPSLAVTWAGALWVWLSSLWERIPALKRRSLCLLGFVVANLLLGLVNVVMLAPIPLQIAHLLLADILWILFVGLVFSAASRWH
jgi:heme A synthase